MEKSRWPASPVICTTAPCYCFDSLAWYGGAAYNEKHALVRMRVPKQEEVREESEEDKLSFEADRICCLLEISLKRITSMCHHRVGAGRLAVGHGSCCRVFRKAREAHLLLHCRPSTRLFLASASKTFDHDRGHEAVHGRPSQSDLSRVGIHQQILQSEVQCFSQDRPMLLFHSIMNVPHAQFKEHWHQLAHIMQTSHSATDCVQDLAEESLQGWGFQHVGDVCLIHRAVCQQVVVTAADIRREQSHRIRPHGEEVHVQHFANSVGAKRLDTLPAVLHCRLHLLGGQIVLARRGPMRMLLLLLLDRVASLHNCVHTPLRGIPM
mmetsp:Transcript_34109/g.73726  ORF Transcript_34109/g.73726 Transcript_34109/m.73726 type:complete len:323 (-) Transcript_34109:677-1645(-)